MSQSALVRPSQMPSSSEVHGHVVLVAVKRDGSARVLAAGPKSQALLPAKMAFKMLDEVKLTTSPLALSRLTDRAWLAEAAEQYLVQQRYADRPFQLVAVVKPCRRSARLKIGCIEPL